MGQSPWLDRGFPHSAQAASLLTHRLSEHLPCRGSSNALVKGLIHAKCISTGQEPCLCPWSAWVPSPSSTSATKGKDTNRALNLQGSSRNPAGTQPRDETYIQKEETLSQSGRDRLARESSRGAQKSLILCIPQRSNVAGNARGLTELTVE